MVLIHSGNTDACWELIPKYAKRKQPQLPALDEHYEPVSPTRPKNFKRCSLEAEW